MQKQETNKQKTHNIREDNGTNENQRTSYKQETFPKPKKLRKRYKRVLKSKSTNRRFLVGTTFSLIMVTIFSMIYFSMLSIQGSLTAQGLIFTMSGAFVGSCFTSLISGLSGLFKDSFDALNAGILQSVLLWTSMLPVALVTGASPIVTILGLIAFSVIIPSSNVTYSDMGENLSRSD